MVGAHTTACCWPVREHGHGCARSRGRSEGGFTLIELLVVLVITAILFAIAGVSLFNTRGKTDAPLVNVGAGAVWRAINEHRMDNHGVLPTTALLTGASTATPAGSTFVNPGNGRYIKRWPEHRSGSALRIYPGGATAPNAPIPRTDPRAGNLEYGTGGGATPTTGWLVGYSSTGAIVFRRTIAANAGAGGPIG